MYAAQLPFNFAVENVLLQCFSSKMTAEYRENKPDNVSGVNICGLMQIKMQQIWEKRKNNLKSDKIQSCTLSFSIIYRSVTNMIVGTARVEVVTFQNFGRGLQSRCPNTTWQKHNLSILFPCFEWTLWQTHQVALSSITMDSSLEMLHQHPPSVSWK